MHEPPPAFNEAAAALGLTLTDLQRSKLARFLHRLLETNKQFNLTAIRDPDEAWTRHILDSLSLLPFLRDARTLADVGSGGGLPGIPLAIMRPDLAVTLIEATGKKARFLAQAAGDVGLANLRVVTDRAETVGQDRMYREKFDLVVARAIGPMNVLLELTLPLVRPGGRLLAMKGARVEEELAHCDDALIKLGAGELHLHLAMPAIEEEAVIVEIHKQNPTPRTYPRPPGTPKMQPL